MSKKSIKDEVFEFLDTHPGSFYKPYEIALKLDRDTEEVRKAMTSLARQKKINLLTDEEIQDEEVLEMDDEEIDLLEEEKRGD